MGMPLRMILGDKMQYNEIADVRAVIIFNRDIRAVQQNRVMGGIDND